MWEQTLSHEFMACAGELGIQIGPVCNNNEIGSAEIRLSNQLDINNIY